MSDSLNNTCSFSKSMLISLTLKEKKKKKKGTNRGFLGKCCIVIFLTDHKPRNKSWHYPYEDNWNNKLQQSIPSYIPAIPSDTRDIPKHLITCNT